MFEVIECPTEVDQITRLKCQLRADELAASCNGGARLSEVVRETNLP
jgi:hypothetical protein